MKRTPLWESHRRLGARLVEFGGWDMPVQYDSILTEHAAVRTDCGMFDISHMGEVRVSGALACDFLNRLLTNNIAKIAIGQGQYNIMCNDRGGAVDDLYVYRIAEEVYLLVINASRIDADLAHIRAVVAQQPTVASTVLHIENLSDSHGGIAVQGPRSAAIMDQLLPGVSTEIRRNRIAVKSLAGAQIFVARTGYTGEDGFELIIPSAATEPVWELLLKQGVKPCGLGARDTLRTEVCYPLYGHELDENTSPIEAGLEKFVALEKPAFIGKEHLQRQKLSGSSKMLVAFRMADKSAPPRPHYKMMVGGEVVGEVCSGTMSPSLNVGIGLGYVSPAAAAGQQPLEIEIRGKRFAARLVPRPIYSKNRTK